MALPYMEMENKSSVPFLKLPEEWTSLCTTPNMSVASGNFDEVQDLTHLWDVDQACVKPYNFKLDLSSSIVLCACSEQEQPGAKVKIIIES